MSDSDGFLREAAEELQRDRLFALMRRWGWLAILIVVAIVGAAAFAEYRRAQAEAAAQAFGDAVLEALEQETSEDRLSALAVIEAPNVQAEMLLALYSATEEAEAGQPAEAAARLRAVAVREELPQRYRDLALLKAHIFEPEAPAAARLMLDRLAQPGAPYRPLAIEQLAYLELAAGNTDAAIELLREAEGLAQSTPGLQQRAGRLIVALEAGSVLSDAPLPEPTAEDAPVEEAPAENDTDGSAEAETPAGVATDAEEDGDAAEDGGDEGAETESGSAGN